MEVAYSTARSAAPCLCFDPRMCRCIAVTIYRPATASSSSQSNEDNDDEDNFPLFCKQIIKTEDDDIATTTNTNPQDCNDEQEIQHVDKRQRTEEQEQQQQQKNTNGSNSYDNWDVQILKRIRVHRVSSLRELMHDLLTLCGKPLHEQPRAGGAIIIDDIDQIIAQQQDSNSTIMMTNSSGGNTPSWQSTSGAILQTGT